MHQFDEPETYPPLGPVEEEEPQPSRFLAFLRELVETVVLALVLFLVINLLTARVRVDGPSMEPSYQHNNRVVVSKVSYWFGDIQRGDVVVFPAPPNPNEDYIKRVIGLPGDRVSVANGSVFVNGVPIEEPYINAPPISNLPETVVPEGMVFVMGDNRNVSSDSRSWGPLQIEDIIGKAVFVYWPLDQVRVVEHYELNGSLAH